MITHVNYALFTVLGIVNRNFYYFKHLQSHTWQLPEIWGVVRFLMVRSSQILNISLKLANIQPQQYPGTRSFTE